MAGLKQMLKNEMDKDRSFATNVSKIAGYANPTGFYRFLNKDESEFKDIQKLVEIVQFAFPDREYDIMDDYIRTLKPNNLMARQALEYASINKLDSLFEFLLDELSACSNAESKEWAMVYKIDWDVACGRIKPLDAIEILNTITVKSEEMKVFLRIAKFYCYHDLRLIDILVEMSIFIENGLKNIKNSYMYNMYYCRFTLIISNISLHTGNIDKLRIQIKESLNKVNNSSLLAVLYHTNGISYLFTDYEEGIDSLNKGLEFAEKACNYHWVEEIKRSHNFFNNFWGKQPLYLNEESNNISDVHEIAFYNARNNKDKAISLLNNMDIKSFNSSQKGFHYFYKGLATDNKEFFYDSIEHFNDAGDKFYKKIATIELRKRGESERVLKIFEQ